MGAIVQGIDGRTAQRHAALAEANRVRSFRASLKRELKVAPDKATALRWAAEYVADPEPDVITMSALELLASCRQMGRKTAKGLLSRVGIRRDATLGGLTVRERLALVERLVTR